MSRVVISVLIVAYFTSLVAKGQKMSFFEGSKPLHLEPRHQVELLAKPFKAMGERQYELLIYNVSNEKIIFDPRDIVFSNLDGEGVGNVEGVKYTIYPHELYHLDIVMEHQVEEDLFVVVPFGERGYPFHVHALHGVQL